MSSKVQQSVCSDCVTYAKSRIDFNHFNTFNDVKNYVSGVRKSIADMLAALRRLKKNRPTLHRTVHGTNWNTKAKKFQSTHPQWGMTDIKLEDGYLEHPIFLPRFRVGAFLPPL